MPQHPQPEPVGGFMCFCNRSLGFSSPIKMSFDVSSSRFGFLGWEVQDGQMVHGNPPGITQDSMWSSAMCALAAGWFAEVSDTAEEVPVFMV